MTTSLNAIEFEGKLRDEWNSVHLRVSLFRPSLDLTRVVCILCRVRVRYRSFLKDWWSIYHRQHACCWWFPGSFPFLSLISKLLTSSFDSHFLLPRRPSTLLPPTHLPHHRSSIYQSKSISTQSHQKRRREWSWMHVWDWSLKPSRSPSLTPSFQKSVRYFFFFSSFSSRWYHRELVHASWRRPSQTRNRRGLHEGISHSLFLLTPFVPPFFSFFLVPLMVRESPRLAKRRSIKSNTLSLSGWPSTYRVIWRFTLPPPLSRFFLSFSFSLFVDGRPPSFASREDHQTNILRRSLLISVAFMHRAYWEIERCLNRLRYLPSSSSALPSYSSSFSPPPPLLFYIPRKRTTCFPPFLFIVRSRWITFMIDTISNCMISVEWLFKIYRPFNLQ